MPLLYHLISRPDWEATLQSDGPYQPDSLLSEGFIHFSTKEQVLKSATRFFQDFSELVVLELSEKKLKPHLKYEAADGEDFPHYYAPLPLDLIGDTHMLMRNTKEDWEWV